ncbi:exopolysaccharide production protein ExoZ [Burkholderia multivorans]
MRFNNIQILRLAAAVGVVIFHAAIYVHNDRGGQIASYFTRYLDYGVMLFFVISGFVVTAPAVDGSRVSFLVQRFLRIFPPFWVLAVVASVAKLMFFGVQRFDPSLLKALSLLPFGTIPYPVGIEWSLVYEVFFYVAIAALAVACGRRYLPFALAAWSALIVAANFIAPSVTAPLPTIGQIALSAYDLPFIFGVAARLAYDRGVRVTWPAGVSIAVALLAICVLADPSAPLRLALLGLAFAALVLVAVSVRYQLRHDSIMVRGGDWSYGIYLMHVPVIQFLVRSHHFGRIPGDMLFPLCAAVALASGALFGAAEFAGHRRLRHVGVRSRESVAAHGIGSN